MKKKYKILLLILMVILIICLGYRLIFTIKANILFGANICTCTGTGGPAGDAITPWKCNLCGNEGMHANTAVSKLCDRCALITGRCARCGHIKNYIYKELRRSL